MRDIKLLIIPDVHGRLFWQEPVKDVIDNYPEVHIVFLGDYLSPYPHEHISHEEAWERFWEIDKLKMKYPERVTLLFGNHDAAAIDTSICECRYDYENDNVLHAYFTENLDMFDLAYECKIGNKQFFISHAGLTNEWLFQHPISFKQIKFKKDAKTINKLFHEGKLWPALSDVGKIRSGDKDSGSIIWADVIEHHWHRRNNSFRKKIQIFGHSQQWKDPVNMNGINYCLDCRQAFYIDGEGEIRFYNTDDAIPISDINEVFAKYF